MKTVSKSILIVLSGLIVLAMVLSACSSPATEAPTEQPNEEVTQKVPATEAPTEQPKEEVTQKVEEATEAPKAEQDFSSVRVAVVPGGPHPYFLPMEDGLADAVKDFGLGESEFKTPPEWKLDAQNQLINSMVAQGFNAFGIFPGDANATNATVDELVDQDIPVLALAGCLNEPTSSTFCLATDVGQSAYLGTKALIEALGGEGKIIHLTGFLVDPNTQKRIDAVQKAVDETNGSVELVDTLADIDSQEEADKKINSYLAAHGDEIDGIIASAYVPSTVAATALRNLGDKRIKMVAIDDDPIVLDAIRDGFLVGTMAQNPYGQAYVGAQVLAYLKTGCERKADAPYYVDSGTLLISNDNIDSYKEDLKALTKEISSEFVEKYLTCP